ncbi:MAG: long-chain fatty acid transporter [Gammaproteobacteria bacterium]|nr:MAG: long-chain fatty acid transporter [Gammaproteobacteria bacterium]RKZ70957.1 MAG: long-chain fatty acid transporter [Gammaproteobacteria bacterium]
MAQGTQATTGYFASGYGPKSTGMAGATVASPQDALAAASNPAGMAHVGERIDLGIKLFSPHREASFGTTAIGSPVDVESESTREYFLIPSFGITRKISDKLWAGLSVYGNGGMNTSYKTNVYDQALAAFFGAPPGSGTGTPDTGTLGVDLAQAIAAPTLSFKINDKHTVGVSVLLAAQQFKARGLGNFQCFTPTGANNNPAACAPGGFGPLTPGFIPSTKLTDNGHEWSFGAGVRGGWLGQVTDRVRLGVSAASKVYMTEFDDYRELFAEQGGFDIPATVSAGINFQATAELELIFDYEHIFYGDVDSIANPGPVASPFGPAIPAGTGLLGTDNGLGFGWEDIDVYRFATVYQYNDKLILRAGYSYNDSPIPDDQILFNIIAPAVNKHHLTFGLTYAPHENGEWNIAYMHAFEEKQDVDVSAFGIPASIEMYQNALEVGYSWKF